jgi:hypothetical protein
MTIGIGAIGDSANTIVMATDTKGSYQDPRFSDTLIGKQYDFFPHNLLSANIAGTVPVCKSVVSSLVCEIDKLLIEPVVYHDHVRRAIQEAQIHDILFRLDYELVNRLGMSRAEWLALDKISLQYRRAQRVIRKYQLPMQLTVGGFVTGGSIVMLEAQFNEPPEMVEWSAIGTGGDYAAESLGKRNQGANTSFQRTLVHVAEAMEAARADQYVGEPSDYVVITQRTYRRFPARDPYLGKLLARYANNRDTDELDDSDECGEKLSAALSFPNTTREELAKGMRRPTGAGLPIAPKTKQRFEGYWLATEWNDGKATFSLPRIFCEPITMKRDSASVNDQVYLVVDCQTVGCWVHLVARHCGEHDPQRSYVIPKTGAVRLYCNVCTAANDYGEPHLKFIRGPKVPLDFRPAF